MQPTHTITSWLTAWSVELHVHLIRLVWTFVHCGHPAPPVLCCASRSLPDISHQLHLQKGSGNRKTNFTSAYMLIWDDTTDGKFVKAVCWLPILAIKLGFLLAFNGSECANGKEWGNTSSVTQAKVTNSLELLSNSQMHVQQDKNY